MGNRRARCGTVAGEAGYQKWVAMMRGGGDDRRQRGGHLRCGRRAPTAGRELHQHAAQPNAGLGGHLASQGPEWGSVGMIPAEFDYTAPESLQDAISALSQGGEDAKLLAGGHSLIPLMKLRLAAPSLLIDIRKVPGLQGIQRENGSWRLGALDRHTELERAAELGVIAQAAGTIAESG